MENFCLIDPTRRPLSFAINIEEELRAGGDFKIIDPDTEQVIEHFKLDVNNRRSQLYTFETNVSDLSKKVFSWSILICSRNPNLFKGKIEFDFAQLGMRVKTSYPLSWNLKNVPPCKHKSFEKFTGSLIFLNKDIEEANNLSV